MLIRRWSIIAVLLTVFFVGCDGISDLVSIDADKLLELSTSAASAPADGATRVTLTAKIPEASDLYDREIAFTTNMGTFVGGDVDLDDPDNNKKTITVPVAIDGKAYADLTSSTSRGNARVQAVWGDAAKTVQVNFSTAYPQYLDLSTDLAVLSVSGLDQAEITVHARRNQGVASEGTRVLFSVADRDGIQRGIFQNVMTTDANGYAKATYFPGDTRYRGFVTITATFRNPNDGKEIKGQLKIDIIG
ncbi:hypothetical protein ACFLU6_06560 [Acidobacteriota bacterium]